MVFNGTILNPNEKDIPNPITEYGKQKLIIEKFIMQNFQKHFICRLTKVFGTEKNDGSLFTSWFEKLINNDEIAAPSDIFISPIFISDVVQIIIKLIMNHHYGIYHIGGKKGQSMFEHAIQLANYFKFDFSQIKSVKINDFTFLESYPKYNNLDSTKLHNTLSVSLTPLEECLKQMAKNYSFFSTL